jgi:hypothetical protein
VQAQASDRQHQSDRDPAIAPRPNVVDNDDLGCGPVSGRSGRR